MWMKRSIWSFSIVLFCASLTSSIAAVDPATGPMFFGSVVVDLNQWQRIDFNWRQPRLPRAPSQIKVAIRTKGLPLQGLIRISGALTSNFDTGGGTTVVDLVNARVD